MFTSIEDRKGQCLRTVGTPTEVLDDNDYSMGLDDHWEDYLPPAKFLKKCKRKIRPVQDIVDSLDDESIFVELAWASRDPGASNCPRSREELRQRLGFVKNDSNSRHTKLKSSDTIFIEGIGDMPVSDESAGGDICSDFSEDDKHDSVILPNETEDAIVKNIEEQLGINILFKKRQNSSYENQCKSFSIDSDHDVEKAYSSQMRSQWVQNPHCFSNQRLSAVGNSKKDCKKHKKKITVSTRDNINKKLGNTTYMIRNPSILAPVLLQYLIPVTLASHEFDDALQLMSLYLLSFSRGPIHWLNPNDYRLFKRFFSSCPDMMYSTLYVNILQSSYSNPTFLRHDILFDLATLWCCSQQPEQLLDFAQRESISTDVVKGSVSACIAYALYSQLIQLKAEELNISVNNAQQLSSHLLMDLRVNDIKRELDVAISLTCKKNMILPTMIIRLITYIYVQDNIDKVLCILEDFLSVVPSALDVLELKLLLLQKRSYEWDMTDYLSGMIYHSDDLHILIETTLKYSDVCRGEPQSLTIILQSFQHFPLDVRLRCLFLFLKSNPLYTPAWRVIINETLALLGNVRSECTLNADQRIAETAAIWQLVDEVLGSGDKMYWHRMLFNSERTILNLFPLGDRILLFLILPFFNSDPHVFLQFGQLISSRFLHRQTSLLRRRTRSSNLSALLTTPCSGITPSEDCIGVLRGFQRLIQFVYWDSLLNQHAPQVICLPPGKEGTLESDSYNKTVASEHHLYLTHQINIDELAILTDAAFYLNPRPSIQNTTRCTSIRWNTFVKQFQ